MKTIIQELVHHVYTLTYDKIPPATQQSAKQVVLDAYGNVLSSALEKENSNVDKYIALNNNPVSCQKRISLLSRKEQYVTIADAIFIYAIYGRMADMDDGFTHAMGHPGSFLVPAALVLAKAYNHDGKRIIETLTSVYDVYARIGEVLNPYMHRERGFDATCVFGSVAATALIGKLKGLSQKQTENAVGLASLFSGGLIECQYDGTSGKYLCGGWAISNACQAVRLAESGFTGSPKALEGKAGLFQGFQSSQGYDYSNCLTGLGESFKIDEVYFKQYACIRGVHASLDAVKSIVKLNEISLKDIEKIEVRASNFLMRFNRPNPKSVVEAQGSLQLTIAIILLYGHIESEKFLMKCLEDEKVRALMKVIFVTPDEEMQKYLESHTTSFSSTKVVIYLNNGSCFEELKQFPDGELVGERFGWEMLSNKFANLLSHNDVCIDVERKISFIKGLEQEKDLSPLFVF